MKDHIKNSNAHPDGFKTQWQCRQQWEKQVEKSVPDNKTFLKWVDLAQLTPSGARENVTILPFQHNKRWIPYAAAASIVIAVGIIGLLRLAQPDKRPPTAEQVTVESQTIHFLCNNGCSAQDIMVLASKVFN